MSAAAGEMGCGVRGWWLRACFAFARAATVAVACSAAQRPLQLPLPLPLPLHLPLPLPLQLQLQLQWGSPSMATRRQCRNRIRSVGCLRFYGCGQSFLPMHSGSNVVCAVCMAKAMRRILRAMMRMAAVVAQPRSR